MQSHLTIIIERGTTSYSAYAPDLLGCVAAHKTLRGVKALMKEAVAFHIAGMAQDGIEIALPERFSFEFRPLKPVLLIPQRLNRV